MKLINIRTSYGENLPVIVRNQTSLPILLPLTYSIIKLKGLSPNTKRNQLIPLKLLYEYSNAKGFDLDELIINAKWIKVKGIIEGFISEMLKQQINGIYSSPDTINLHLRSLSKYFEWTYKRFNFKIKKNNSLDFLNHINSYIISHSVFTNNKKNTYNSLSALEKENLLKCISPISPNNPFAKSIRLRNYLIFTIFIYTGIRLSELLNIRTTDLIKLQNNFYIRIQTPINISEDTRKDLPRHKNNLSNRMISISKEMTDLIESYIMKNRKTGKNFKKIYLNHGYLFSSELGKPISKSTINDTFRKVSPLLYFDNSIRKKKFSPHDLRHTFADNLLQFLIEEKKIEMELAKDELRKICGWTNSSTMPSYYANRYIHKIASKHNLERIQTAFENCKNEN